jgi:hypothetical protein
MQTTTNRRLSRQMKAILIGLGTSEALSLPRRQQADRILEVFYGGRRPATEASLYRSLATLRRAGLIALKEGQWRQTLEGFFASCDALIEYNT